MILQKADIDGDIYIIDADKMGADHTNPQDSMHPVVNEFRYLPDHQPNSEGHGKEKGAAQEGG